jgi:DNA-binding transcriptional ArsR family regulator
METYPRMSLLTPPRPPELAAEPEAAESLSDGFRALADPRRLQLLHLLLTRDELCVCELLSVVDATPSNLSFHLNALRQAGFIRARKQGRWVFYAADRERLAAFQALFCLRFDPAQPPVVIAVPACCDVQGDNVEASDAE